MPVFSGQLLRQIASIFEDTIFGDLIGGRVNTWFPVAVDENGFATLPLDGNYTIVFSENNVRVEVEGGRTLIYTLSQWEDISIASEDLDKVTFEGDVPTVLDISDPVFIGADISGTGGAETETNIDTVLEQLLATTDAGTLASVMTMGGSQATAIAVLWEYLDDGYVEEGYYASVNENFVLLGVAYAEYLAEGGAPLTDLIGKFTADDSDADTIPERLQSLHDNLLGNLGHRRSKTGSTPRSRTS